MHRHHLTGFWSALAFTILFTSVLAPSWMQPAAAFQGADESGVHDPVAEWQELGFSRDPCTLIDNLRFDGDLANASVSWQVGLGPRTVESNSSAAFRSSIIENLSDLGWNTSEDPHNVTFSNGSSAVAVNVVASLAPNSLAYTANAPIVVLAAHYDTRPTADYDPNPELREVPIDGANDGASGVAVLMEMARVLPLSNRSVEVVLLFTDVEDHGDPLEFLGAKGWADNLTAEEVARTRAFVLVDMIGDADLSIGAEPLNSDPYLMDAMLAIAAPLGAHAEMSDCNGTASPEPKVSDLPTFGINDDHTVVRHLFPAALLIDVTYGEQDSANPLGEHWHTTGDTPDKVSAESLQLVGRMVELALASGLGESILPGDNRTDAKQVPDVRTDVEERDKPPSERGLHIAIVGAIVAFSVDLLARRWKAISNAIPLDEGTGREHSSWAEDSQAADAPPTTPEG